MSINGLYTGMPLTSPYGLPIAPATTTLNTPYSFAPIPTSAYMPANGFVTQPTATNDATMAILVSLLAQLVNQQAPAQAATTGNQTQPATTGQQAMPTQAPAVTPTANNASIDQLIAQLQDLVAGNNTQTEATNMTANNTVQDDQTTDTANNAPATSAHPILDSLGLGDIADQLANFLGGNQVNTAGGNTDGQTNTATTTTSAHPILDSLGLGDIANQIPGGANNPTSNLLGGNTATTGDTSGMGSVAQGMLGIAALVTIGHAIVT